MEIEEKIKIAEERLKNHLNKYPGPEAVIKEMMDVVGGNIESSRECQHGREILDDVICDLIQYRDSLASPEEYLKKNLL